LRLSSYPELGPQLLVADHVTLGEGSAALLQGLTVFITQWLVILGRVQQRTHHRVLRSSEVLEEPLGSVDLPFGDLIHEAVEPLFGLGFHGVYSCGGDRHLT
jgi:hypothetical protein